jgi:uncharacterized hydantoinase/oxoprolinase family protein
MGKRLLTTPRSKIRQALRQAWLRSRERLAALKRDKYTCQVPGCGKKQSEAKGREVKVNVHHRENIDWDEVIDLALSSGLFCGPEKLVTMCEECHNKTKTARQK